MLLAIPFLLFAAGKIVKTVIMVAGVWKVLELTYNYYVLAGSAIVPLNQYNRP